MTNRANAAGRNNAGQPIGLVFPVSAAVALFAIGVAVFASNRASGVEQGRFRGSITARVAVLEENDKRIDEKLDKLQQTISGFERNTQRDIGEIKGALGIDGD